MTRLIPVHMETRTCSGCGAEYRVLFDSPQEFCSHFCMQLKSNSGRIPMNCLAHAPEEVTVSRPKTKAEIELNYYQRQPVDKRKSRKGKDF